MKSKPSNKSEKARRDALRETLDAHRAAAGIVLPRQINRRTALVGNERRRPSRGDDRRRAIASF